MAAAASEDDPLRGYDKADLALALGQGGKRLRFDSGYEVWDYELDSRGKSEIVVLFAPSGVAARAPTAGATGAPQNVRPERLGADDGWLPKRQSSRTRGTPG